MKLDIDLIPHNIVILKKELDDFTVVALNQTAEQKQTADRTPLKGESLKRIFSGEKDALLFNILDRVLKTGQSETFDLNRHNDDAFENWPVKEVVAVDKQHVMVMYKDLAEDIEQHQNLVNLGRMIDNSDNEYFIFSYDDLRFTYLNESAQKNIGYSLEEMSDMTPVDIKPDYSFSDFIHLLHDLKTGLKSQVVFETRHKRKDGTLYDVEARVQLQRIGKRQQFVSTILDITDRKRLMSQLDSLGHIIDNSLNEVYIFNRKNLKFSYANQSAQQNIGYTATELTKLTPVDIKPHFNFEGFIKVLEPILSDHNEMVVFETTHQRKDGSHYNVEARVQQHMIDAKAHLVAFVSDITERKKNEAKLLAQSKQLQHMANHDNLTNLPNRALFIDRLKMAIKRSDREQASIFLLFIDIDNFKPINDTFGHAYGDHALKFCANQLRESVRASDTVARLGGDEFVVIIENVQDALYSEQLAKKLIHAFSTPHNVEGTELELSISIGIASYPQDAQKADELLAAADLALYKVKQQGKSDYHYYRPTSE